MALSRVVNRTRKEAKQLKIDDERLSSNANYRSREGTKSIAALVNANANAANVNQQTNLQNIRNKGQIDVKRLTNQGHLENTALSNEGQLKNTNLLESGRNSRNISDDITKKFGINTRASVNRENINANISGANLRADTASQSLAERVRQYDTTRKDSNISSLVKGIQTSDMNTEYQQEPVPFGKAEDINRGMTVIEKLNTNQRDKLSADFSTAKDRLSSGSYTPEQQQEIISGLSPELQALFFNNPDAIKSSNADVVEQKGKLPISMLLNKILEGK